MEQTEKLFDADAPQRVPLALVVGGEAFDVTFNFKPLSDDQICSYIDFQGEGEFSSLVFRQQIQSAEGCADENDQPFTAEDLGQIVPAEDQAFAVDAALLGTRLLPAPKAARKLNWRHQPTAARYRLAAYFNGGEIITSHTLTIAGSDHHRVFSALERNSFPVKFGGHTITGYAQGLVLLYDALEQEASGYVGRVPAHHKMVVAAAHLRGQRELVLGK